MPRLMDLSISEKEFIHSLLHDNATRLDGRQFDQLRPISIQFGSSLGNVQVSWGNTKLVVRISAELTKPSEDRPQEGVFVITTDISSMASPHFENNRSTDVEEILLTRIIEKSIRRSNAIDLESLCVQAGLKCWAIRADVHYLEYDGALVDATCFGVVAGLLHFKRPDTSIIDGNQILVHPIDERPPVPLSILHIPICVTFSFYKPNSAITNSNPQTAKNKDMEDEDMDDDKDSQFESNLATLMDATAHEELFRDGEMTVTINKNRDLCQISKTGGISVPGYTLINCSNKAFDVACKLTDLIQDALSKDQEQRSKGEGGANVEILLQAENSRE